MLYYSHYDSALQVFPASPCSVSFSLCMIPVSRNPALYSSHTLSKSPTLLSVPLAASEGLSCKMLNVLDIIRVRWNSCVPQLLLTPATYQTPSTSQAHKVEMPFQVSLHRLNTPWLFFIPEITNMLCSTGIELLIILQNHNLKEYMWFEVCCAYPENTFYAGYTEQGANQACSQWSKGLQTGCTLCCSSQFLPSTNYPLHCKAESWG